MGTDRLMWIKQQFRYFYGGVLLALAAATGLLSGCGLSLTGQPTATVSEFVDGGNPQVGWATLQVYGCQSCHNIPGVPAPDAYVGPPLDHWPQRSYIVGLLPNTPENLIHWLRFPQEVEPDTAMPTLGLSEAEARDIAAYLYTLDR